MIVITGGAGFIGSAIIWQLNSIGRDDIVVADHLGKDLKWRNLARLKYADYLDRYEFMKLLNEEREPWPVEAIVHMGACSSTTETDADFLMENNFHYSRNLCRHALSRGARFINASSAATYGNGENGFSDAVEITEKLMPLNMYGYSKHLFDLWLIREKLADAVASLKFFNVYGPNEYHKASMQSVACKLFAEINNTGKAVLFASNTPEIADGEQKRDFVYVKDCAKLVAWLMDEGKTVNGIFNVGTGKARTFNDVAKEVFKAMNRQANIKYIPMPDNLTKNYQNYTCADMTWLKKMAYPHKFQEIEYGIQDYVSNYLAKPCSYL